MDESHVRLLAFRQTGPARQYPRCFGSEDIWVMFFLDPLAVELIWGSNTFVTWNAIDLLRHIVTAVEPDSAGK